MTWWKELLMKLGLVAADVAKDKLSGTGRK
jgi:hypothetical protein